MSGSASDYFVHTTLLFANDVKWGWLLIVGRVANHNSPLITETLSFKYTQDQFNLRKFSLEMDR